MPRDPTDPDYIPFEFRPGIEGFPDWGGQRRDGDPSFGPANTWRLILNADVRNGEIQSRGGQEQFNTAALLVDGSTSSVRYLHDYQPVRSTKLWFTADGCPGVSAGVGFSVSTYDDEQDPPFQRLVYYPAITNTAYLFPKETGISIATDATLRNISPISTPFGVEAQSLAGFQGGPNLFTLTGNINWSLKFDFDDKIMVAEDLGAGASIIHAYYAGARRNDLTGINPSTGAGLYRDSIVIGFAAGTNQLRVRSRGVAPGTWTTVAGTCAMTLCGGISYKDVFYFGGGADTIYSFDGTSIAAARVIAGATTLRCVDVFNNLLVFGYTNATSQGVIGSFDGSTWTDSVKNITSQFASNTGIKTIKGYRGNLFATGTATASNGLGYISPGTNLAGTWTLLPAGAAGTVNDVLQMTVY